MVDLSGMILKSDVNKYNSLLGVDVVGKNIDEIIPGKEVHHYMNCLKTAVKKGHEICSYTIGGHVFVARFKKISSKRVRVIERDVTDLSLQDVLRLF